MLSEAGFKFGWFACGGGVLPTTSRAHSAACLTFRFTENAVNVFEGVKSYASCQVT